MGLGDFFCVSGCPDRVDAAAFCFGFGLGLGLGRVEEVVVCI